MTRYEDKSNEITAIPALLDLLDTKRCIVTIDAMGCQEEIATKIIDKKSDYILAVKDNKKNLHDEIIDFFFECAKQHDFKGVAHDYFEEISKGHGRIETRKSWISKGSVKGRRYKCALDSGYAKKFFMGYFRSCMFLPCGIMCFFILSCYYSLNFTDGRIIWQLVIVVKQRANIVW